MERNSPATGLDHRQLVVTLLAGSLCEHVFVGRERLEDTCGFCGTAIGPFARVEGLFDLLMCPRCQLDRGHSPGPYPAMAPEEMRVYCHIRGSGCARPGRSGHSPPTLSIARPISASGERNPNAIRVSTRSLVLTDSTRALDSPCSRLATIPARCAAMVLASLVNAGMRQRLAHDSHASSSATPWPPLTRNTNLSSSLSR